MMLDSDNNDARQRLIETLHLRHAWLGHDYALSLTDEEIGVEVDRLIDILKCDLDQRILSAIRNHPNINMFLKQRGIEL